MSKVIKINRILSGNNIIGQVSNPSSYRLSLTPLGELNIIALYSSDDLGKKALFLINVNLTDIDDLDLLEPKIISKTNNWQVIGSSEVIHENNEYLSRFRFDSSGIGICGIASYCPSTSLGDVIQVTL